MSVNGVASVNSTYAAYTDSTESKTKTDTTQTNTEKEKTSSTDKGVVYDKHPAKMTNTERKELVAKLKADSDRQIASLKSLVEKMFLQQGKKFTQADDMWKALANGDLTVDPETAAQAKEDISEDGYWGVEQTSQRIFEFAQALSGGDEEKMNKMLDAFKEGFSQATKSWGKDLPDISQQTYDAVLKKFDDYKKQNTADVEG